MSKKIVNAILWVLLALYLPLAVGSNEEFDTREVEYIPQPPAYAGFYVEVGPGVGYRNWVRQFAALHYIADLQGGAQNGFGTYLNGKDGFIGVGDMGYQWGRVISSEIGFYQIYDMLYTVPPLYVVGEGSLMTFRSWVAYIGFKFSYAVYRNLYVIGKLGAGYSDINVKMNFIPALASSIKGDYWSPIFGFGLQYYFDWNWSISFHYMFFPANTRAEPNLLLKDPPTPNTSLFTLTIGYKLAT